MNRLKIPHTLSSTAKSQLTKDLERGYEIEWGETNEGILK